MANPRRILITGSREWTDHALMKETLLGWGRFMGISDEWPVLVHGAARGADSMAASIWSAMSNPTEAHPAKWDRKLDGSYNKYAGFQRNQEMVNLGADICLAFLKSGAGNRGTRDCMKRASDAGIEVVEVWG